MPDETYWTNKATENLVGKKIVATRYMTDEEMSSMLWYNKPIILILDDGSLIYPSRDDEGNGAGALFGQDKEGNDITLPVLPVL